MIKPISVWLAKLNNDGNAAGKPVDYMKITKTLHMLKILISQRCEMKDIRIKYHIIGR